MSPPRKAPSPKATSRRRAAGANDRPFADPRVAAKFEAYPAPIRKKLLRLRRLIFDTASKLDGVGEIEETLKWGEPSYLTSKTRSGSTIRLDSKGPDHVALYFHCQTNLVPTFRGLYPDVLRFEGNRAIVFTKRGRLPVKELRHCLALALTYHRDKRG